MGAPFARTHGIRGWFSENPSNCQFNFRCVETGNWSGDPSIGVIKLNRRRLIQFETEIADHLMGVGGVLAWGGQIAVDEHRVGRIEAQRLQRTQVDFSAAGDADLFAWVDEAEQAEGF